MAEKAKYIDVKELSIILDTMKNPDSEFATDDYIDGFSDGISAAIKELEAFPTADVAPVRHAKWVLIDECVNEGVYCSNCHKKIYRAEYANQKVKSNFCPNCGAKMDGKENNDNENQS